MAAKESKTKPATFKPVYTKEKARHLFRVYMAIVCGCLLIGWMQLFLIKPLSDDQVEMVSKLSKEEC